MEVRFPSPSNMKLKSPRDHFISEKSPSVEFSLKREKGGEGRRKGRESGRKMGRKKNEVEKQTKGERGRGKDEVKKVEREEKKLREPKEVFKK